MASVGLFLLMAFACGQVAKIVAEGGLFAAVRGLVRGFSPFLGDGISCVLCVSTWAGLVLATLVTFSDIEPRVVGWFIDGLALAFAGRTFSYLADLVERLKEYR